MRSLLLVRHGQASFGAEDYDVLSETGWEQSRALGRWLAEHGTEPAVVVRGDMRRHRETVEALLDGAGWTAVPEVEERWDEFDHLAVLAGMGEQPTMGSDRRAFQRTFESATARWIAGDAAGDGGAGAEVEHESFVDFTARTRGALESAIRAAPRGGSTLVVTSGGVIAAVCAVLIDPDGPPESHGRLWQRFNTVIVNSSMTRVVIGSTGARLLTFNEHPHLPAQLRTYR